MDESVKPILPPLDEALRATAHGLMTFLVTAYGQPARTAASAAGCASGAIRLGYRNARRTD